MASLRDYVSEKLLKFPNQNGNWVKCELSDSGYQGDTGPELSDVYYNYTKHIMYNNVECEASIEQRWSKLYNEEHALQAFYPIIGISLETSDEAYLTGALHEIGEGYWWDTSFGGGKRDDLISGGLANYKVETKFSGDLIAMGYAKDEYNFAQYYDGIGFSYPENYVREGSFNEVAYYYNSPYYDRYFYKVPLDYPGQQINVLMEKAFVPPQYISGNARVDLNGNPLSPFYVNSNAYTENTPMLLSMDTNVPVIVWDYDWYTQNHQNEVNSAMHSYLTDGDLTRFNTYVTNGNCVICNGYVAPSVIDNTKSFQCYSDIFTGYWDEDSVEDETSGSQSNPNDKYRYLQVWVAPNGAYPEPRASLYKAKYGNELRCNIKIYGDLRQYKYSVDGGNNWTTVEKEGQTALELPWEYLFYKRTNEKGWLSYDKNHGGNMLLFDTEALCDDGSPYLASDYDEKNFYYPATNSTGTVETTTLMGTTGLENGFCERYILNKADIDAIANDLLSSNGMNEDLVKGVEMLGENPINAVHGLMYFPVNVATLFNAMTSNTIFIGGYALQTPSAMKMVGYNGYFDIGAMQILESFPSGDYRNYEPYCNLNIYLPFVGLEQLKMNKYVGKTLSIRYYIDVTSGECMACLFADGLLTDYFIGNMGISLSITLNDYSQYAGAHISGNKAMLQNQMSLNPATQLSNLGTDLRVGGGSLEGLGTASVFNVSSNALSNFATTKGTDSSMLNHYLPNYVYVIFEIVETDETSNLLTLEGRRSNASGTVGSFSGYLQVESVNLKASGATESEKRTIKDLLAGGIYI